ncbi:hypothetical protein Sango_1856300 [Sesamum angolense]|uniref:Gag-pol polyprotein n=1 Tax=Sesamum angolense TaxID=2727404 RepID=A0AAE1WI98_9LAMI|nr:hypothetical protein Sango_1856300 [Sesamum angolense]
MEGNFKSATWIDNAQLRKVNTPLTGFSGEMIEPLGEVMLPLSLGSLPKRSTKMIKFLVVKAPSAYNIILGRPSLNLFRVIASTFHMKLKFPTLVGVGEVVGDELMAKVCYVNILKRSRNKAREERAKQGKIAKFPLRNSSSVRVREERAKQGKIAKFPLHNSSSDRAREEEPSKGRLQNSLYTIPQVTELEKEEPSKGRLQNSHF